MATIRKAIELDIPDLVEAGHRSWLYAFGPFVPFESIQHWAREDLFRGFIETQWDSLTVTEVHGKACGFVQVKGPYVAELFLHPDYHRRGLGTQMLDYAEKQIARKGHKFGMVDPLEGNTGAVAFYRTQGWKIVDRYDGVWGHRELTCLVMIKEMNRDRGA